ncbi:MAG: hypothetical protein JSS75_03890 [Bacteroidetes bacterium]|nr:hypothetical protein [Bacteroidota bacterium]
MSLFKMTAEQRADQDVTTRLFVSYIGTMLIASLCVYLAKAFGMGIESLHQKEGGVLLLSAITTLSTAANTLRWPWKTIVLVTIFDGLLVATISLVIGINF